MFKSLGLVLAGVLALVAGPAFGAIDVGAATTAIGDASTAITTVGGLLIGLAAVAMALRWVKAMFF